MKKCSRNWAWLFTIFALCLAPHTCASGPNGTDDGWAIDNNGRPLLTPERATQIAQGGTGWVRIGMRRIPGQSGWQEQDLQRYDAPVNTAIAAGLQVFILIGEGAIPGGQTAWNENNYEHGDGGSNGQNQFINDFVNNAVIPIIQHFHDRAKIYEIWNEPNAWTRSPAPGYYEGGTWIYPSNYSWVLAQSWVAVHAGLGLDDVTLFFGGVFGHSIGGQYSYARAGAQYIDDVYNVGINSVGSFAGVKDAYGSYPLDGVGQHLYIDQGGLTTTERMLQYLDWVRQSYTKYEGADSNKKVFITEMGWTTASVSEDTQDQNLRTAFAAIEQRSHIQMTIWFRWQDVVNPRLLYGVLDAAGHQKQSYAGYQFYQSYEGRLSDHSVQSDILDYYSLFGQPVLGNPYDNGGTAWVHPWGDGVVQDLNGGSNQKLAILSSVHGTFQVNDLHGLWTFYLTHDGISIHGYPLNDEYAFCNGTRQDFDQGFVTWDPVNGGVDHP